MEHRKDISIAIVVYYLAKRKMNLPTNFDEIAKIFDYDLKERHSRRILHRIFKKIRENIGMKTCKKSTLMGTKCLLQDTPKKYVEDLCNKLGLSETILKKSLNKLKKVEKDMIFMGNHPQVIAGGIVYIICRKEKINITQRKIGDILNITEVSLRNVYFRLYTAI
jgi:transcription initiation factor TFIIIB Brf1 subunit/transcription initiation factor TFIIB